MKSKLTVKERLELIERILQGEPISKVAKEVGISRVIFHRWIKRYKKHGKRGLVPAKPGRPKKSLSSRTSLPAGKAGLRKKPKEYRKLTPHERLRMVEEVVLEGKSLKKVADNYEVSRNTLYKWIARFNESSSKRQAAVEDKTKKVKRYYRQSPKLYEEALLSLVEKHPEYGIRSLVRNLPKIGRKSILGHHGVQNILRRYGLSTFETRRAYSEEQITPITRVITEIVSVTSRFFALPFKTRSRIVRLGGIFALSAFSTIVVLGVVGYLTRRFVAIPVEGNAGLFFATIALFMGSIFFLYSLKYYLTLAVVLSFSQSESADLPAGKAGNIEQSAKGKRKGFLSWLLGLGNGGGPAKADDKTFPIGLTPNLEHITLKKHPFISVHIPLYNEKYVTERAIRAATNFDYPGEYEVILCDDSTDETTQIIKDYLSELKVKSEKLKVVKGDGWTLTEVEVRDGVMLKHLHRTSRSGFKGGALRLALRVVDPRTEFISVFDADFVPYPDTLELFLKYFQATTGSQDLRFTIQESGINHKSSIINPKSSRIAAVQGYQWHVLNKSENWITRGVRSEYAGSYVIERSGTEIYSGLKQISGAVYMVRRDVLEEVGWETSITEDFQLTLKLYERGYKVVYTPYIQAPAECVSTLKRLIRQRMRWAEGHSNNVRKMFTRLLFGHWSDSNVVNDQLQITNDKLKSNVKGLPAGKVGQMSKVFVPSPLTLSEKLEFLYLSPYYLQAFFFLIGTMSWLLAETLFPARLPFWTSLWGWSLVLTNLLSLPLMNAVGLFLEESEERDYLGLASFFALTYILVPFQAYAALKGFLSKEEGPWFRTPKTGKITDIFTRGRFYRFISGILPGRVPAVAQAIGNRHWGLGLSNLMPKPYNLNPSSYLSLATANSQFNSFSIKPKRIKWLSKVVLSLLLALTVTTYSATHGVPEVLATNPSGTFNLDNVDSSLLSGTNWRLLDNTSGGDSTTTQIAIDHKSDTADYFQYTPGATNSGVEEGATNCTSITPDGNGWIFETQFGDSGSIASGTWTFYFNESDGDSDSKRTGHLDVCVWRITISGGSINTSTLIYNSANDGSWPTTDIWDNGVNNTNYTTGTVSLANLSNEYLYVEYFSHLTNIDNTGPPSTFNSTFRTGPTFSDPRIVTPAVTIPEVVIAFLVATPLIPYLVHLWIKRRKEHFAYDN